MPLSLPPRSEKRARLAATLLALALTSATLSQTPTPAAPTAPTAPAVPLQFGTRPVEDNDTTLRPLSAEEVPPNLNFYAIDPLYRPGRSLGWSAVRLEEKLDRGLVARPAGPAAAPGSVYLSWRLLKSDSPAVAFNVYRRDSATAAPRRLNANPIALTTDFLDTSPLPPAAASASPASSPAWFVRPVVDGRELPDSDSPPAALPPAITPDRPAPPSSAAAASPAPGPAAPSAAFRAIKLLDDVTSVGIIATGDLDGDGIYDFVVKHPGVGKDPGRISVSATSYKFDAYNGRTGAFMWRHDLGWNVDAGIWWTPMVVRDLDGDNRAEVIFRTKPYAATLADALPGARAGNALEGPEWVAVHDGLTGRELDHADWIELQSVQHWGDNSGNRASRHLLGTAYLDGKTPAILVARGTYGVMKIDAWTFENKKLRKLWRWTNERAPFLFHGQGQHSLKVGDIDGDGRDEILNGTIAIAPDGRTLWGTGLGHGDRFYLTDVDPARPGLEVVYIHEDAQPQLGFNLRDARTGDLLWGAREPNLDNAIDQCAVGDIDPAYPGMEVWINKGLKQLFYTAKGEPIPGPVPPTSELVWWDADLLREQVAPFNFTGGRGGRGAAPPSPSGSSTAATPPGGSAPAVVSASAAPAPSAAPGAPGPGRGGFATLSRTVGKWKGPVLSSGIQGQIHLVADLLGDWREEIVTFTAGELRIYSTTIPAKDRRICLMQDPIYRHDVTHRSMGYPHVPQLSYYLGEK